MFKHLIKDLLTMRKGRTVNITVWDGFTGKVKIIKNRLFKWYVEIDDVSMCYPQQVPFEKGDKTWVYRKKLFRHIPNKKKVKEVSVW